MFGLQVDYTLNTIFITMSVLDILVSSFSTFFFGGGGVTYIFCLKDENKIVVLLHILSYM